VHRIGKTDGGKVVFDDLVPLFLSGVVVNLLNAKYDVILGRHPREEAGSLEHYAAIGSSTLDFFLIDEDASLGDVVESGDHGKDGRLAATGVAEDADELAFLHFEIESLHDDSITAWGLVGFAKVNGFEIGSFFHD